MPDGASIVLNASIVGSKGFTANRVYSATKAAVRSFARTWTVTGIELFVDGGVAQV
jgi:NAD(P)-dependent dehydrogenase (short-subunit alcohol dehydrogenase family)